MRTLYSTTRWTTQHRQNNETTTDMVDATIDLLSYLGITSPEQDTQTPQPQSFHHLVDHLPGGAVDLLFLNDGNTYVIDESKLEPLLRQDPPLHWAPDDVDLALYESALDLKMGKSLGLMSKMEAYRMRETPSAGTSSISLVSSEVTLPPVVKKVKKKKKREDGTAEPSAPPKKKLKKRSAPAASQ